MKTQRKSNQEEVKEESGVASPVKPLDCFLFDLEDYLYLLCFQLFFGAFLSFLVESYCALAACVWGLATDGEFVRVLSCMWPETMSSCCQFDTRWRVSATEKP